MAQHLTPTPQSASHAWAVFADMPEPSAEQLPVRTMSRLDVAALLYGPEASLHAAWECFIAERPVHWIEPGWAVQQ